MLPFSMSGDGVEDIDIPSVFMKKADADFLVDMWKVYGEEVMVKLDDSREELLGEEGGSEEQEGSREKEEKEGGSEGQEVDSKKIKSTLENLHNLLEEIDEDALSKDLKESVAKELDILKALKTDEQEEVSELAGSKELLKDEAVCSREERECSAAESDSDGG